MNRYVTLGLVADAMQGKRILVLTHTAGEIRNTLDEVARVAPHAQIRRHNGNERATFPQGGVITVRSHRANLRGLIADVVYLDTEVDRDLNVDGFRALRPIIASSSHGEIIRA